MHEPQGRDDRRDMGEIWEGYGRDSKHLFRALSPLYKGLSKTMGEIIDISYIATDFWLMRQVCRNIVFLSLQPKKKLRKKLGM